MATAKYIGARYVPIFGRKGEESVEWDKTKPYEPLTIVLKDGDVYTSRQMVPANTEITNKQYWVASGSYGAKIDAYIKDYVKTKWEAMSVDTPSDYTDENYGHLIINLG